jgi:small-conductance mechanosensitive channel
MEEELINEIIYTASFVIGGMILYQLTFFMLRRWSRKKKRIIPFLLNEYIYYPGMIFIITVTLWIALSLVQNHIQPAYLRVIRHIILILAIVAGGFLLLRIITVLREVAIHHYESENPLDFSFRKAKTKFQLIQRVINFLIILAVAAIVLMTFESIRQIGSTLLASAGVVGLIIGFAAQKSLGTLFAGIQIAISQPIRLDDTVVVEDQFGTIGEITLTYVVVNTWDGRRLVVPINYFLENSFENWTRHSPEVIGKVKIHADYSLPVDEVRNVFLKWVEASPLWDKRSCDFLVTGADDKTIEIRATMSVKNSSDAWELECYIREKLVTYIRENHPQCLPKSRINILNEGKTREEI